VDTFEPHERETIAAAMARIIPTTDTPGAREAGTIDFLERYLSGTAYIFAEPDGSGFQTLEPKLERVWAERVEIMRAKYADGVAKLDELSTELCGARFVELAEERQDEVLRALEASAKAPPAEPEPATEAMTAAPIEVQLQQAKAEATMSFFELLVTHTSQGYFSDPIYGGNKDRVGWKAIGWHGPESLADVQTNRYTTIDWFAEEHSHPDRRSA
jgi:gluconate 2-dehydrogenase gamma chain